MFLPAQTTSLSISSSFRAHTPFQSPTSSLGAVSNDRSHFTTFTTATAQYSIDSIPYSQPFPYVTASFAAPAYPSPLTTLQEPHLKDDLSKRQGVWRGPITTSYDNPACSPITLQPGMFLVGTSTIFISSDVLGLPVFHPRCLNGRPVAGSEPIPTSGIVEGQIDEWHSWLDGEGQFSNSVVPLMYSIAASSAACWLLTLVVMGFQHKRPILYKLSLVCASIYLLLVLIFFTDILNDQFDKGYLDSTELKLTIRTNTVINALNLAFNTILYISQVQTAMSLFNRQKEKRLVLWLGLCLIVVAQTTWGLSTIHPASTISSLPAFAYLFQTAMGVLYTCCVLYYAITNRQSTLQPSILLLTILAIVAAASQIILFIVDLVNVWIVEWSDAIAWVTTVLSIVTVREWADRIHLMERHREKNGILGRQLFESEMEMTMKPHSSDYLNPRNVPNTRNSSDSFSHGLDHSSGSDLSTVRLHSRSFAQSSEDPSRSQPSSLGGRPNVTYVVVDSPFDLYNDRNIFLQYFHKAVHPFIVVSDALINFGLSVSRPLSSSSSPSNNSESSTSNEPATTTQLLSNNHSLHTKTLDEQTTSSDTLSLTASSLSDRQDLPQISYPLRKNNQRLSD